jgi:predicted Fe-S protein YdhL (DUF1289 family)
MAKRSTNFTGHKPMKAQHMVSIAQWLGMTDEEIKAMAERMQQRINEQKDRRNG